MARGVSPRLISERTHHKEPRQTKEDAFEHDYMRNDMFEELACRDELAKFREGPCVVCFSHRYRSCE